MNNEQMIAMFKKVIADVNNEKAVKALEDSTILTNNYILIAMFAYEIEGANIERLQQIILDSNDLEAIYLFAANVKGIDITPFQDKILKGDYTEECNHSYFHKDGCQKRKPTEKLEIVYKFARDVEGADIEALQNIILNADYNNHYTEDANKVIVLFARDVKGADIDKLSMLAVKVGTASLQYDFVNEVPSANYERHENAIIKMGAAHYILRFARDFNDLANVEKLQTALIKYVNKWNDNASLCYDFANEVKGADVSKLASVVLQKCNGSVNYWFARDVEGADILAHQKKLMKCVGWEDVLIEFANNIEGADVAIIEDMFIERKDFKNLIELASKCELANVDKIIGFIETYNNGAQHGYADIIRKNLSEKQALKLANNKKKTANKVANS
ncbi:MAG: hypothetical protein J5892_04660 [Bacilli bacterium]|nr:hypothetical protein [Bacilli bacterium]